MKKLPLDIDDFIDTFIQSSRLRSNIKLSLNYIIEVFVLSEKADPKIKMMFYKDIIIHLASIAEAILYEKVRKMGNREFTNEFEIKDPKIIKKLSASKEIVWAYRVRVRRKKFTLKRNTDFKVINEVLFRKNIITKTLFDRVEMVRKTRNKIHLAGLSSIDKKYRVKDIDEVVDIINEIISVFSTT